MRRSPAPRAPRQRIRAMPAHVMVREYPETLALLRRRGVDLDRVGTHRVGEFADPKLVAEIEETILWRPEASPPSS